MFAITNDHSSHKGRGQSWWKIFFRAIFNIHDDDDDDDDNLRERRVQFQQCLNTCSRFLVLPVRDFLVNIYNFHVHIVHNQDGDC